MRTELTTVREIQADPAAKHDLKRLRIFLLVFFIAAAAVFGVYKGREFLTADNVAPVIKAPSDSFEASVSATDADLMNGMTATDNKDGDEFMLDFDAFLQPYVNFTIDLF